jgi:hypothetical protein
MTSNSSEPNFNNNYLVFGHGARLVNEKDGKNIDSSFPLDSNYRIVTLHVPDGEINDKLVKIITNQISKKANFINNLFLIGCPVARGIARKELEKKSKLNFFQSIFCSLNSILFEKKVKIIEVGIMPSLWIFQTQMT